MKDVSIAPVITSYYMTGGDAALATMGVKPRGQGGRAWGTGGLARLFCGGPPAPGRGLGVGEAELRQDERVVERDLAERVVAAGRAAVARVHVDLEEQRPRRPSCTARSLRDVLGGLPVHHLAVVERGAHEDRRVAPRAPGSCTGSSASCTRSARGTFGLPHSSNSPTVSGSDSSSIVLITSTNGTRSTAARNSSGRMLSTAPIRSPPALPPSMTSRSARRVALGDQALRGRDEVRERVALGGACARRRASACPSRRRRARARWRR